MGLPEKVYEVMFRIDFVKEGLLMKISKTWLASAIMGLLIFTVTYAGAFHQISTNPEPMSVTITRPGEGETIYAGPETMLYSISITGIVHMESSDPAQSELKLEIFFGDTRVGLFTSHPDSNGDFSIPITVNPDKNASELTNGLTLDRNTVCLVCHFAVSQLSLMPGAQRIRVTVTAPSGQQAFSERQVTVDRGGYAMVPVKVVLAEDGKTPAVNVRVTGGARLYMWRARYSTAFTDADGYAEVRVEALTDAPTHYLFQVEPMVVDGILYESVQPVEVTLPPGAVSAAPVTLQVSSSLGQISGRVSGLNEQAQIWAISIPDGSANVTKVSSQGTFSFPNMDVGKYLLAVDSQALAEQGLTLNAESIDLSQSLSAQVVMNTQPLEGASLTGKIISGTGESLPFAWVSLNAQTEQSDPATGAYALLGYPAKKGTAIISAPGYYSQAYITNTLDTASSTMSFNLVVRPQTEIVPWGDGKIVIPPETVSSLEGQIITFEQGWLWGTGQSVQPIVIKWDEIQITIPGGRFALERLPDRSGWLYMMEGQANIQRTDTSGSIPVEAGEMVLLSQGGAPNPVKYDPVVVKALRINGEVPIAPVWQPSLSAQMRDRLARIGIGTAQIVTFITYFMEVLALLSVPLIGVIWIIKKNKKETKRD